MRLRKLQKMEVQKGRVNVLSVFRAGRRYEWMDRVRLWVCLFPLWWVTIIGRPEGKGNCLSFLCGGQVSGWFRFPRLSKRTPEQAQCVSRPPRPVWREGRLNLGH